MSMSKCSRLLRVPTRSLKQLSHIRTLTTSQPRLSEVKVDEHGIPLRPTWSVNELLSSYPKPTISPSTLRRIHELSALVPPVEGTDEHKQLTLEMENLVKLVEAVKLVDTSEIDQLALSKGEAVPDGRIWAEGTRIDLQADVTGRTGEEGQSLLRHAARTENGMYVVDTDRRRK